MKSGRKSWEYGEASRNSFFKDGRNYVMLNANTGGEAEKIGKRGRQSQNSEC